jgi:hypothetical protein
MRLPVPNEKPSIYPGLYYGIVEQRVDPLRVGKLRVRIVGLHDSSIKVEHLPWAFPRSSAWDKGGFHNIPPLGAYVYIDFLHGHHEYPVWSGGWWGSAEDHLESADGKGASEHKSFPTSWFGGDEHPQDSILKLEQIKGVEPEDAPNNYAWASPLNKRLEFDDRKGRERVVLGDQLDNMIYFNTEDSLSTWEVARGHRKGEDIYDKHGITLSSDREHLQQGIQVYTGDNWRWTINDLEGITDFSSPIGHKIRITNTPLTADPPREILNMVEVWTQQGYRLVLDEGRQLLVMKTPSGRSITLDDGNDQGIWIRGSRGYMFLDDTNGIVEFFVDGDMRMKSTGNMSFCCNGAMTFDGADGIYLNEGADSIPAIGPNFNIDPTIPVERFNHGIPNNPREFWRASDFEYYLLDPEKVKGDKAID